MLNIFF